jgi:hypothetical protein
MWIAKFSVSHALLCRLSALYPDLAVSTRLTIGGEARRDFLRMLLLSACVITRFRFIYF